MLVKNVRNTWRLIQDRDSLRLRSRSDVLVSFSLLIQVPMLTSYHDDYPQGEYHATCLEKVGDIDLKAQECPLERLVSGKSSFTTLDFPDNYFDIITAGFVTFVEEVNGQKPAFYGPPTRVGASP